MDSYVRDPRLTKRLRSQTDGSNQDSCHTVENEFHPNTSAKTYIEPVKDAPPPFDKRPGEAVFRSSDGVIFRVRRAILIESSAFFSHLLTPSLIPTKRKECDTSEFVDGIEVISLQEHSHTLDHLLRFCYPIEDPEIKNPLELGDVLDAARKYEMTFVVKQARKQFAVFAEREPLRMYMMACRRGWVDFPIVAAKASLACSSQCEQLHEIENVPAGQFVTSSEFNRLQSYHRRCGAAASSLISPITSTSPTTNATGNTVQASSHLALPWLAQKNWVWFTCQHYPGTLEKVQIQNGEVLMASGWWINYLRKTQDKLKRRPRGATILDTRPFSGFALSGIDHCSTCKRYVIEDLTKFGILFAEQVEKAIDEVRCSVSYP
ncbi:hypothetical protein PHLCEN_2v94 [Hermanssonia centrifuga]|uniref:BTB domain-containing protein n=1 Tax=Hermanssonia centrifuga TaxID=98765 RepID=A0A2R6S730_9APHY|nr:hypothetical protein PHLCEN_2v94 [Hermanssonia centrifuga]